MRKILISVEAQEKQVAIVDNSVLEEFYVERTTSPRLAGNIYKGRVNSILPGLGAGFIDLGLPRSGFLYVSDITEPAAEYDEITDIIPETVNLRKAGKEKAKTEVKIEQLLKLGQEILVQIVKEPTGKKGPRLTTNVSLPGRYLVLKPNEHKFGISRRIEDVKERGRLRDILKQLNVPPDIGLIVRTAGVGATKREFLWDFRNLLRLWRIINKKFNKLSAPSLIHAEYGLVFRIIRDLFTDDVEKLVVDSKFEYKNILRFLNAVSPRLKSKVFYYSDGAGLFEKENIEKEIAKIYEKKINLKKGGYIFIEQTEGMVAIDVNSGKFVGKRGLEETVFLVNLEAAKEIARQIRLRDLGGIIVIDFIDMRQGANRLKVFETLKYAMAEDKAKAKILSISEFGLVEMTRQKIRKGVESVMYQDCPYCKGRGRIKSVITVSILALRKINLLLKKSGRNKRILAKLHPDVAARLASLDLNSIRLLERQYSSRIDLVSEPNFHIEQIEFSVTH